MRERFEEWAPFANAECEREMPGWGPVADYNGAHYRLVRTLLDLYEKMEKQ